MKEFLNKIIHGECSKVMKGLPDEVIDLTVTSPPYDSLRKYNGYEFNFEEIARELYRVTKQGGVVVWVTADATENGSETGTSFRQALYFRDVLGFKLHDTMIYQNLTPIPLNLKSRYNQEFEYMFVLSKGSPKTSNIAQVPTKNPNQTYRVKRDNETSCGGGAVNTKDKIYVSQETKNRGNIWAYTGVSSKEYHSHPAQFPERMALDHIESWSNKDDVVLDPMCGSGTTCVVAALNDRNYIGIDGSKDYVDISSQRVDKAQMQLRLF